MPKVTTDIRIVKHAQLMVLIQDDVKRDLLRRGNRVLNRARSLCPVDQGTLRASLHVEPVERVGGPQGGGFGVRIGSNLDYAIYVHEGHGVILPIHGQFLRWPFKNNSGSGRRRYKAGSTLQYVFARRVGPVPGRPFLRDALPAAAD